MCLRIALFLWIVSVSFADDYYELLGVKRDATQKEIRRAFKNLAVAHHPDKNNEDPAAHDKFIKYTTAYEILKDRESRKKYDVYGEEGLNDADKRRDYRSWSYYRDNFGIYDEDPRVVTLNENDYHDSVVDSEKMWMINFYSPVCAHCRRLAPAWRRVAKELEGVVRIGAVNCEDDWQLCHRLGIRSYPTLLHYPTNSKHGIRYVGEKTHEAITRFLLDRLDVSIDELTTSEWTKLIEGSIEDGRATLVFARGASRRSPFTSDQRLRTAAIFDKILDVRIYECLDDTCEGRFSQSPGAVFVPSKDDRRSSPLSVLFFEGTTDTDSMIRQIFQLLPEPRDLDDDEFEAIRKRLGSKSDDGWLLYFYLGRATELDFQLKRLPGVIRDINLGKLNCGKYSKLCSRLDVNRYPMWGVLKPGGAFELSHGKDTINDIAKFAENSIRAKNVWALSAEQIISILKRENGNEAWFVDWYAPWCPPCMQFLPEVRKASLEFEKSVVHFGTVDCTVHSAICRQYNIRSYPTAMLINGSTTLQFTTVRKTAANVVRFIREAIDPTVVRLTSKNYDENIGKKKATVMWAVDYFAPWCGPCQQLAPEWTAVAKIFRILPNVKIASVDCETESWLCASQGVSSYPTIRLYPLGSEGLGKVAMYTGSRDSLSLSKWIARFLPVKVPELNVESLERDVLESDDVWLVDYYAPWCRHCQTLEPNFAIAAQLLEGKARLGRFDCNAHKHQCSRAGIRAYPTLMIYTEKKAHRRRTIDGGDQIRSTNAASMEQEVLEYLKLAQSERHDEL